MSELDAGDVDDRYDPSLTNARWLANHKEALDEICRLLAVKPPRRREVCDELCKIAIDRGINWAHTVENGRAKAQNRAIEQLITRLKRTIDILPIIDSDYLLEIEQLTHETSLTGDVLSLRGLDADINRALVAAQTFRNRYKPSGIKTNIALERAVSALMKLIERDLDRVILFSKNAVKQTSAEPSTNAARAMVIFLKAIVPRTTTTSIWNMIEKLRGDPALTRLPYEEILDVQCPSPTGPSGSGE